MAPPVVLPQAPRPPARPFRTPVPGAATLTIKASARTPSPSPSPLDANDMPQAFTDATPLPEASAQGAEVASPVKVPTPKPTAKPHGWLHRTLMHFDPFKPGGPH